MDPVLPILAPAVPQIICPKCQTQIGDSDYFCPHCGYKIKDPPPSTSTIHVIALSLGAFFLPPSGLFTGIRYMKQPEENKKNIGILLLILTVLSIIVTIWSTVVAINDASGLINSQLGGTDVFQQSNQPSNSGFINQQLGL